MDPVGGGGGAGWGGVLQPFFSHETYITEGRTDLPRASIESKGVRTSMSICNETYTWSYMYIRLVS